MYKKSTATTISIVLILSSLFLFSCVDPNNTNPATIPENYEPENNETNSHSAMIGTWVNPEDSTDTITITDTEVIYSVTAIEKLMYFNATKPYTMEISDANTVNKQTIDNWKAERKEFLDEGEIDLVRMDRYKNNDEYCTWEEKIDIEFSDIEFFQKTPSLFFEGTNYIYIWLDSETLNVQYMKDFLSEAHKNCTYLKKGSKTDNSTSSSPTTLTGSYSISEANGSTFTFSSDGTWTYEYNSRTSNGSWSLSDNELTLTYFLGGYSSSAVFTVAVSGSTYTLTGKSGDYTTIISSAFKITNQSALENGIVTLVKQ